MERRLFLKQLTTAALSGGTVTEATGTELLRSSTNAEQAAASGEFFYRPKDGYVGDVIPFYWGGRYRIFYLHRIEGTRTTAWFQASTTDFVHFVNHGEMLPPGSESDQDLSVATGSIIERRGQFHCFYTGYSSVFKAQGKPEQGILHATSDDLLTWKKLPGSVFYAPQNRYERNDWRDPFVFWNEEANEYWMLIAARLSTGSARRKGCTALYVSRDLSRWEMRDPFWTPGLYMTHECPDLFKMGDWWYLIFSEFSERMQTRYRMSRSIHGSWLLPANDSFDTRALYAAKTGSDGQRRFLLGWNPTRARQKDEGAWEWGGNLVVHQLAQESDGTLSVHAPTGVTDAFSSSNVVKIEQAIGPIDIHSGETRMNAEQTFGLARCGAMPTPSKLTATLEFTEGTHACGLALRLGTDLDQCYYVRLEPDRQRVVFDMWPRPGDVPFLTGLERSVVLSPHKPVKLTVLVDDTIGEIYVNDQVAMSTRMYNLKGGSWGIFVEEGAAQFRDLGCFSPHT